MRRGDALILAFYAWSAGWVLISQALHRGYQDALNSFLRPAGQLHLHYQYSGVDDVKYMISFSRSIRDVQILLLSAQWNSLAGGVEAHRLTFLHRLQKYSQTVPIQQQ